MTRTTPTITLSDKEQGVYLLSGDLVYSTVPDFVKAGEIFFSQAKNKVVIDCSALNRVDSAGLSLLLEWKRQCQKLQKECSYEALPKQAAKLIKAFKLKAFI